MPDATANLGNVPVGADAVSVTVISDALKRADRIFGQSHFAPNPDTHVEGGSPLFGHRGGTLRKNNVVAALAAGTKALTVNNTNYIEVYMDGSNNVIMAANTTGFTAGRIPLFSVVVTAGGSFITAITDRRVFLGDLDLPALRLEFENWAAWGAI